MPFRTGQIFWNSTQTGFYFATAKLKGSANMLHLLNGIFTNIVSLNQNKKLKMIQPILSLLTYTAHSSWKADTIYSSACPIVQLFSMVPPWKPDIMAQWKHIQSDCGMTGNLNFYHFWRLETYLLFKVRQVHTNETIGNSTFWHLSYPFSTRS